MNSNGSLENENVHLFTLDVESLYPSIEPELALQAIHEALEEDQTTDRKTKHAVEMFIKLSFENAYVTFEDEVYKSKVGIPTGGSLSRQIADIFLHWILFKKINPKIPDIQAIKLWARFIDDCIGIWRGSRRSFDSFVKALNQETMKFGIKFPLKEVQFGKAVNFLDLTVYLEDDNTIQYRGYTKPTDSKRYLNPASFHPRFVFDSIPFSQMLRTVRNNSKEETRKIEVEECLNNFKNSGYNPDTLEQIKTKVINKSTNNNNINNNNNENTEEELVFPVHHFNKLKEFKSTLFSLKDEIKSLIGNTRVMFAIKKHGSIGNMMVQNKHLSINSNATSNGQKCNSTGCKQCPLVNTKDRFLINGTPLRIPQHLNCKSKNIIYMWNCKLCDEAYFGRTVQSCRNRTSGHRSCFNNADKVEKSALSMHAKDAHENDFSLKTFNVSVVKKVSPQQLRREEFKFIDKYRTASLGLNRYKS